MQWVALKVSLLELVGPPGIKWVPRGVVSGHCAKSLSPAKQIFPRSQLSGLEKPSYGENVLPPHLPQNYATATTKCFSNTSLWYWLWKINGIHLFPRPAQAIFLLPVLWFQMWTFQNFDHLRMRISATWLWSTWLWIPLWGIGVRGSIFLSVHPYRALVPVLVVGAGVSRQ